MSVSKAVITSTFENFLIVETKVLPFNISKLDGKHKFENNSNINIYIFERRKLIFGKKV